MFSGREREEGAGEEVAGWRWQQEILQCETFSELLFPAEDNQSHKDVVDTKNKKQEKKVENLCIIEMRAFRRPTPKVLRQPMTQFDILFCDLAEDEFNFSLQKKNLAHTSFILLDC